MKNFEAIINLSPEHLEKFLDQVFLTGFNTGYQSLVDPDIHDGNPFNVEWLNNDVEEHPFLVEDGAGESLIIEPLAKVASRIVEFNTESLSDDIRWHNQVVLPKAVENDDMDFD